MSIGLYIHVPFCIKKCFYCDFISYPKQEEEIQSYLTSLKKEIEIYSGQLHSSQKELRSVYIGGGTPTCLASGELSTLLEEIKRYFKIGDDKEFTMEANPGTLTSEKLKALKEGGVNRLSLGAQTFDDKELKGIGRIHSAGEIEEAFWMAREAGFSNINLDLIFALPHQTPDNWLSTLNKAASLKPEHISAYSLKIEEGTPLSRLYEKEEIKLPSEEEELQMYEETISRLTGNGYKHYEISNFALPNKESRHNMIYWQNQEYLGLGPGAHSYLKGKRWVNYSNLKFYQEALVKNRYPVEEQEILDLKTEMAETMIMGLRILDGLGLEAFQERFGLEVEEAYQKEIKLLQKQGFIEVVSGKLRLTKRGLPLANIVFREFV